MITLTLPYPPQANNMFTVARGRKIKSGAYRSWSEQVAWSLRAGGQPPMHRGAYELHIIARRPDRRRRDLDNLIKPISDALTACRVIEDDSLCQRLTVEWAKAEPVKGGSIAVMVGDPA